MNRQQFEEAKAIIEEQETLIAGSFYEELPKRCYCAVGALLTEKGVTFQELKTLDEEDAYWKMEKLFGLDSDQVDKIFLTNDKTPDAYRKTAVINLLKTFMEEPTNA